MITNRAESVKPFMVMDVLARAQELEKAGEKVIHLEVGEPDFDTPLVAQEAAIEAIRSGKTHYTHAMGMIELREAICEHYRNEYGVRVSPDRILVTSGTSPALLMIMMAMVEKGEEVILSNPRYACYSNFVEAAGGRVVDVITHPEDGFLYRADEISRALTPRTRGIFINSPSNPTGIVMSEQNLRDVARFDGQYIISDEIYHGPGIHRPRLRDKRFLQALRHDGLAPGIRDLPGGVRRGHGAHPPELHDIGQQLRTGGGHRGAHEGGRGR
jgi:aspartate/methionine/tyrosine aminotransferase